VLRAAQNRPTKNVLGPSDASMSDSPLLKPAIRAPMTMTTITPIATPRMVRAARTLCARSEASAIPTPSMSDRIAYSCLRR